MQSAVEKTDTQTPVHALSDLLGADMATVNAIIMERMQSDVALIPQLAAYLIAAGGKRIRPLLTLAVTSAYNGDMSRAAKLAACVEFIHTATLLHDDVVDESERRRGRDSANIVFGNQASVLVGDFLFSRAFQLMTEDGSLEVLKILSGASATIAEGEVMQLTTANNLQTTMDDYIKVIEAKTAALFAAATEIGPVIAGAEASEAQAMNAYGMNLGIAFQIADDILDYSATREKLGKTVGDDFREGKMTAPVILALEQANDEEREFWTRALSNREGSDSDLAHAQELFKKHNIYDQTFELAHSYGHKAKNALNTMADTPLKTHLSDLVGYSINREF